MEKELLLITKSALIYAYAPYSNFRVGAALLCADGTIYSGCNIENVGGTSCCAERTAIFKAISEGNNSFTEIAISSDKTDDIVPCGYCLQTLAEFCDDGFLIHTPTKTYTLAELLPYRFKK